MFNLETDIDKVWKSHDFGQGVESYLLSEYTDELIDRLRKKHSTPKTKQQDVEHQANLRQIRKTLQGKGQKLKDAIQKAENVHAQPNITPDTLLAWQQEILENVLHDWEDAIVDDKGKKVECNTKTRNALAKKSTRRREWIIARAQLPTTFYPDVEELLGNSSRPSSSEKNGEAVKGSSRIAESV